jgi:hypothetical protein
MAEASAKGSRGQLRLWVVALVGSLLVVPAGRACDGKPLAKGKVHVSVVAILASSTCDKIDAKLACIAKEVQKVHPELKLTGFRMARISCKPVAVGASETFDLALDQVASVTVLKGADKQNMAQLKVTPPTWGEITYTVACGKFVPFVTGYQTKNGEWLILAVRVQPCNGKK